MKRSIYSWCEKEIIEQVIAPKIVQAITTHSFSTKAALLTSLNETYDANISPTQLNQWMDHLGIEVARSTAFKLPQALAPHPQVNEMIEEVLPPGITEGPLPRPMPRVKPEPQHGGLAPR